MNDNSQGDIEIVAERGSFLLIRAATRFAVVERRAGQVYPMLPGGRQGKPVTAGGLAAVMAEEGWLPEQEARPLFDELCERGEHLARLLR